MTAIAKLPPTCDEWRALALKVADAVTKVYEARRKYEAAKSRKTSDAAALYNSLAKNRAAERNAMHSLREHIEQHACSV